MRIDRIRITSLASLHGLQPVVDFTGTILGQAGLVAITGPTGSGKSTLLDGLSLAIFGCTPRLMKDTDHLLSRDAVAGGAEVAFTLDDGSSWIASWYAHRSRKKLDGAVQTPTHQIARANDGGIAASGVTEVKAWVEKNLRLNFDQFRGVMLLAQFDFARFLVADDKDRSLLLEKLTGTDLYAKLSSAAYERSKSAQEQVQQHQLVLAGLKELSMEERAVMDAAITTGISQAAAAESAWSSAQAIVTWWAERRRRQAEHQQRDLAASEAARLWQEAEHERQRLTAAESALQLFGELARLDEAHQQTARTQQALADRQGEEQRASATWQICQQKLAFSAAQLTSAARAAETASHVDAGLASLSEETLLQAREALVQERERTRQLTELFSAGERKRTEALAAASAAVSTLGTQQSALQVRNQTFALLANAEKERVAILAGCDSAALGEQVTLAKEAGAVALALSQMDVAGVTAAHVQAEVRVAAALTQAQLTEQAASLAVSQFELAEQHKQRAESLAGLAEFVHLLESGQPCPLCGAAEHPQPALAGSTLVADALAQLTQATRQRKIAETAAKHAAQAVNSARQDLAQQAATRQSLILEHRQRSERWNALVAILPGLPEQPDPVATAHVVNTFGERLAAARRTETAYATAQEGLRQAEQTLADSERRLIAAQVQQQQTEVALRENSDAVAKSQADLATAQTAMTAAVTDIAQKLGEPVPAVAGIWLEALPARQATARTRAEQARVLREADEDLGAQVRSRLPAGSVLEISPEPVADPRIPMVALRQAYEIFQTSQTAVDQAQQARRTTQEALNAAQSAVSEHQAQLRVALSTSTFADESALRAALLSPADLGTLRQQMQLLRQAAESTRSEAERAALALTAHAEPSGMDATDPTGPATAERTLTAAQARRDDVRDQLLHHKQMLADDDHSRLERQRITAEAGPLLAAADLAAKLSELIGSRDGARFRRFAQALTLDQLVILANHRLISLAPRYQLARTHAVIGEDPSLGLEIIDQEQADAQRPVATLSGGETFLVSLALALALADLKRGGLRLGTLFIDEGFGSLDPATLERCLAILERLQQEQGTQIVVISHVGALHERLAHRIEVRPQGNGRSRLRISGPEGVDEGTLFPDQNNSLSVSPALVVNPEEIFNALSDKGLAISSRSLRKQLGWDEEAFKMAVSQLVQSGRIEQPPNSKSLRRRHTETP